MPKYGENSCVMMCDKVKYQIEKLLIWNELFVEQER